MLVLLVCSSMMLTFAEIDMETLYLRMGHGAGDVDRLERFIPFSPAALTFVSCIWGILACIFLVWVRDCFRPGFHASPGSIRQDPVLGARRVSTRPST